MNQLLLNAVPVVTAVAIVLFALPSFIGLLRQQGAARGVLILAALSAISLGILGLAVELSLPFGRFTFGETLGYQILGLVPWTTIFLYVPLVLLAFWLASKITQGVGRIFLTAIFAVVLNAVIDPALAFMGLRSWENGGPFFGVPILNFGGWLLAGLLLGIALQSLWNSDEDNPVRRSVAYSGFAIIWFWGGVNLGLQQWIPGAAGIGIGLLVLILMFSEKRRSKKELAR